MKTAAKSIRFLEEIAAETTYCQDISPTGTNLKWNERWRKKKNGIAFTIRKSK